MAYTVSAYENSEIPEPRWLDAGTFDSAEDVVACAHRIIRKSLEALYQANRKPLAAGLYRAYLCYGEVPSLFGEPHIAFDAHEAVDWHIRAITRDRG